MELQRQSSWFINTIKDQKLKIAKPQVKKRTSMSLDQYNEAKVLNVNIKGSGKKRSIRFMSNTILSEHLIKERELRLQK